MAAPMLPTAPPPTVSAWRATIRSSTATSALPSSVVDLFLSLNDYHLDASDVECVLTMLAVAAGEMDEPAFASWLRTNMTSRA